ncbi:uncharacterized protein LOC108164815 [Drosophila miranda]|uniref:uncharacterized protein LOC108164815 n=1 Tax=Drosophila miranda TaxID=7229 RepID=UPI00143F57F0|nr:uncharacterized protein LOC108164815 [Drosophila miranda]
MQHQIAHKKDPYEDHPQKPCQDQLRQQPPEEHLVSPYHNSTENHSHGSSQNMQQSAQQSSEEQPPKNLDNMMQKNLQTEYQKAPKKELYEYHPQKPTHDQFKQKPPEEYRVPPYQNSTKKHSHGRLQNMQHSSKKLYDEQPPKNPEKMMQQCRQTEYLIAPKKDPYEDHPQKPFQDQLRQQPPEEHLVSPYHNSTEKHLHASPQNMQQSAQQSSDEQPPKNPEYLEAPKKEPYEDHAQKPTPDQFKLKPPEEHGVSPYHNSTENHSHGSSQNMQHSSRKVYDEQPSKNPDKMMQQNLPKEYQKAPNKDPYKNHPQKPCQYQLSDDGSPKPKMLCKNTDVMDFDKDLKGLDKNSSHKYMEYAPKLCQSPPHQTNQNIFHKHKQEHYQMMSPSRPKVGKQQAKHIQLSPPHQYSCLLEPDKWGREIGGELLAKNSDILTSTSLSEISEKNCEDSTVKQERYNKCGRCSDENGTNSTSTGSTVFGELSDTVVSHLKDYLCGLSTTDNVHPPKSQSKDSQCTNAPKNSAIDNVLDTKKQESYRTQKKASFGKGIPKAQEVRMPNARENSGEFQSMSTLYKSMEYVPKQGLLQYPTQRTSQDLIKEQTQKSYRRASYHKNQKQHSYRTFKLEAKQNSQQKQPPNQQISDFPPFACFSDTPKDDSEESNFEVDKKTLNKLMEGSPKDKLKHTLSGDEHDVFSMASSNSVSTSISAKSGDELRAMIWHEMKLQSVLGDQKSTSSKPRYKDVEENVSIFLNLSQPRDDGNQDIKEAMSKHPNIASLPNLAIDVNAPTTDSSKGSKTDELPQIKCSMSIDDLVNCKVITPMIMKIHNRYMTSMQYAMQLMKYLETVPRRVGQIYKDNIKLEKRKL